jgi:hypothetical protein
MHVLDAAEGPVQFEDQHHQEAPLRRIIQELPPLGAMGQVIGRGLVHIFPVDLPALSGAEVPQGQELGSGS